MSHILGYGVADDTATLMAFIARACQAYQALEEAVQPIDAAIEELGKDWEPRPASFWLPILKEHLSAIHQTETACLSLFSKEQSLRTTPIPILFSATSIGYLSRLYTVEHKLEEAGILLTAFMRSRGSRSQEKQIRERQQLLQEIDKLSKAVHAAVNTARAELDQAPAAQARLLAPVQQRQVNNRRLRLQKESVPSQEEREQGDDC
ncbi:hypothetical protein [Dictyobacter formicarum]|uniref:Uncharacterized protein n=1 Tax=Dictyobacter formicarum TaxID=2778368 RepID=A0ABQ3VQH0_9CHLR|nr:hypothetical protein [Dictyobacter formicarum]GHO88235.1 hypothetical protein KSZ_62410 [Dictyobacter formicarum]